MEEIIETIINNGEKITTEFKRANSELPKNIFETVCAFLNTLGGYIIFGVDDDRNIVGIDKENVDKIKKNFVSNCNNKQVINPTIIPSLEEVKINDKTILYAYIKESNAVHKTKGKVFVRNHEGDFDITDNIGLISEVYNRKNGINIEDKIYPNVSIEKDLRHDLIEKARIAANKNGRRKHPWDDMSDLELLKSSKLYLEDRETGKSGVTLAGIMLFGTDDIIDTINPHNYTDAIYRVDDLDRYDDRDFIDTNLLDMYDRLLAFIEKYTMDRFALSDDGKMRISPISIIAREVVINLLMHRSLIGKETSRIIIYKDKMIIENPNPFITMRDSSLKNYNVVSKNPHLAKFFREIGYADELGSGIRRIRENSLKYSGKEPILEDNEMFRLIIPLSRDGLIVSEDGEIIPIHHLVDKKDNNLSDNENMVLIEIKKNPHITAKEISKIIGLSERTVQSIEKKLKEKNVIIRVGSDKKGYWLFD